MSSRSSYLFAYANGEEEVLLKVVVEQRLRHGSMRAITASLIDFFPRCAVYRYINDKRRSLARFTLPS